MKSIEEIITGLADGSLIQASAFDGADLDALLDQRDSGDFEDDWICAAEDVQAHWDDFTDANAIEAKIDEVQELAFKKCFEVAEESEISGYVSDDFELLAKASAMALESPYLEQMMKVYSNGGIPH